MAASVTVRAIGPVLSSSQSSGAMPAILTSPRVGNIPTTALVALGIRSELPGRENPAPHPHLWGRHRQRLLGGCAGARACWGAWGGAAGASCRAGRARLSWQSGNSLRERKQVSAESRLVGVIAITLKIPPTLIRRTCCKQFR